jgi:phenol hydroxylase P0 protein
MNAVRKNDLGMQCFVRRTGVNRHGMIEFDFSIGDPSLYVEMILPEQAFAEFCAHNKVQFLTQEQAAAIDADREKWRTGEKAEDGGEGAAG